MSATAARRLIRFGSVAVLAPRVAPYDTMSEAMTRFKAPNIRVTVSVLKRRTMVVLVCVDSTGVPIRGLQSPGEA